MPNILPYMHDLAVEKNRGVIFLDFTKNLNFREKVQFEYQNCIPRKEFIAWLEEQQIKFSPAVFNDNGYRGELYIDIPYDLDHPTYKIFAEHIEYDDGTLKIEGINFYYLSLEHAREMQKEFQLLMEELDSD
ncbi:hypothetical protein [Acinetobacter nectaris]|uniref:hypothetical protein n=1 Tax=Acinetobacter nectaris TaxID=1219382 RepID=UPI001F3090C8|nr:hypothetical protein [Acinetobacter nectaris]MCF9046587.1 hypothetical protein [Acinetobacter nectaris]